MCFVCLLPPFKRSGEVLLKTCLENSSATSGIQYSSQDYFCNETEKSTAKLNSVYQVILDFQVNNVSSDEKGSLCPQVIWFC